MTEASAYTVEDVEKKIQTAYDKLLSYSRKSKRAISAKQDLEAYESSLKSSMKELDRSLLDYPDDTEMRKIADRVASFITNRHNDDLNTQKTKLNDIITDLKSISHWRKMESSRGSSLGFSDFRSLRGESKKR